MSQKHTPLSLGRSRLDGNSKATDGAQLSVCVRLRDREEESEREQEGEGEREEHWQNFGMNTESCFLGVNLHTAPQRQKNTGATRKGP